MQSYDISFVIIEYHSLDDVQGCISSINERCKKNNYEIIISSNSLYPPERQEKLKNEYAGFKWIFNSENLGFAKAMNAGMKNASGKCIVITNPDARIRNDIDSAYEYLMTKPDVGVIGPKIVDQDGDIQDSCRTFMTPQKLLKRILKRFLHKKDVLLRSGFDYNTIQPVDWVVGAFMMIKKKAVEVVGLFDEGYFMYVEDMDWCKRFWKQGYKVIYYPELLIEYKGTRKSIEPFLSRATLNRYTIYHLKSYLRFLRKHGFSARSTD